MDMSKKFGGGDDAEGAPPPSSVTKKAIISFGVAVSFLVVSAIHVRGIIITGAARNVLDEGSVAEFSHHQVGAGVRAKLDKRLLRPVRICCMHVIRCLSH